MTNLATVCGDNKCTMWDMDTPTKCGKFTGILPKFCVPTYKPRVETVSGLIATVECEYIGLNPDYWDCECEFAYIHNKTEPACFLCGAVREEQPDSRLSEIGEGMRNEGS